MQNRSDPTLRPAPEHAASPVGSGTTWERPRYEVISLDCEITSYAPDGEVPLF